ncbi:MULTISPECIES: CaiB/BaiF CoA transferase family protein [Aurantimonas]|uniref:CaiB/BaiF CoA transferase family protein n=1 Tax=Aurantimonas TaxID=182269 RepID=UPI000462BA31|nr:CaiB/BaiF CoA-transferase family protein [Aurantimonas coralicida]MCW7543591.1 CoA transferase [Aurantimonas litoralis]
MPSEPAARLPLAGIRVLDFGHTVMGPTCGLILADLGADVIKIEPAPRGDPTRTLKGFGTGYFGFFNRNKRSIALDLKTAEGQEIAHRLVRSADVLVENFAPGTMDRLGLSAETVAELNPRLVNASLKGFLKGPYDNRLALDEVVQMMAGLAYMTGPPGQPLRAGTSVVDITGGMFAVIGILAALMQRGETGKGAAVGSALFESCVFLVGQHLAYASQIDEPVPPMPARRSSWAVYELFTLKDGEQMFVGITTDAHWKRFCAALQRDDLGNDPELATNNQRVAARGRLIPIVQEVFRNLDSAGAIALCEAARIPFAPIAEPADLFDDPHLEATGGLLPTTMPNGTKTRLPRLPFQIAGHDLGIRSDPPAMGADTDALLAELGYDDTAIGALRQSGVIVTPTD